MIYGPSSMVHVVLKAAVRAPVPGGNPGHAGPWRGGRICPGAVPGTSPGRGLGLALLGARGAIVEEEARNMASGSPSRDIDIDFDRESYVIKAVDMEI